MNYIVSIIDELNKENGSNYKMSVLKKYQNDGVLKHVLKLAYDRVAYTYGITMKNVVYENGTVSLEFCDALDVLEHELATRKVTGNAAIELLSDTLSKLDKDDALLIEKIIGRDLKINLGKTQINKVFKGLITKPVYMRCDVYSKKTSKNISFPAICQLKSDGTYREFTVEDGRVSSRSRSGESYEYPIIFEQMKSLPEGVYTGELTVRGYTDRAKANGLINSDNPPHDDIVLELWDYIELSDYQLAAKKDKKNKPKKAYGQRWEQLLDILENLVHTKNIKVIPYYVVNNLKEALKQTSEWMSEGYEGAILKDFSGVFKDGTSKHQLKLKLEISAEMRCVGFQEGSKGTKREGKVGSIVFQNDEGTIKGRCSGFTDEELDHFTENQDSFIGKIMEVQFNDLSKASGNDYYALSHPRFIEWRNDKDETDTLDKVFKLREMAMELS